MFNIFYCPKCKFESKSYRPKIIDFTLFNFRDGYGKTITHYKCCNCDNLLAGEIKAIRNDIELEYYKTIIDDYNEGGIYFEPTMIEKAKQNYNNK